MGGVPFGSLVAQRSRVLPQGGAVLGQLTGTFQQGLEQGRARAAEDAARQAAHALSQARELSARLEVARENADSRLIHVIQTIEGEIEGPIEALANRIATDMRMEALSPEAIEARLRDLKQDRDRLGAVNLRADTELAEIETRHSDLTRERAEIEEAIRKLN